MTGSAISHPCPICRDTGIAHSAPYLMGTAQGDLYTMTACSCPAGKRLVAEINEKVKKP